VAGGVVVTYRTYRQNKDEQERTYQLRMDEQDSRQLEQDRTYDLRQAEQVNELYTRAVEQLGHEQAPVRLGALYSLVHLAQANPDRRQTVVDVLCAYLRMPYAPAESAEPADVVAGEASSGHRDQPGRPSKRDPAQELQVRLTAERLVSEHVRRPDGISGEDAHHLALSPDESYWPNINLDLTGAYLIGLNLDDASVVGARFSKATFSTDSASFDRATFTGDAWFGGATFTGHASFGGATFTGRASFGGATFTGHASFGGATFTGRALFDEVTFTGDAGFTEATFGGDAMFDGATLSRRAQFDGAKVLNRHDMPRRVWPNGWIVRANADDRTRGTLVHEPPGSSSEPPDG
jgi:Pentapeptide repeats (9 copies)